MEPVIELKNVNKEYMIGGETVKALDNADITIGKGEFVSVIGPSGSGKSTMMNIVGCLDRPDSGIYKLDGTPVEEYGEDELAEIRNKKIGFVFQDFDLVGNLTAEENVALPLVYMGLGADERRKRAEKALMKVGLKERADHRPNELSGGQQQRVAIARAIVTEPSLILADEPTGNLDSRTGEDIMGIFHDLHEAGSTIVLITHDKNVAGQAARMVSIKDGRIGKPGGIGEDGKIGGEHAQRIV